MRSFLAVARFQLLLTGSAAVLASSCIGTAWLVARQEALRLRGESASSLVNERARAINREVTRMRTTVAPADPASPPEGSALWAPDPAQACEGLSLGRGPDKRIVVVMDAQGNALWRSDGNDAGPKLPAREAPGSLQQGYLVASAAVPTLGWDIHYFVPESEIVSPLFPMLRKSIAVGSLGIFAFGLIAFFFQRSYMRMEGVSRAARILHDLVHDFSLATSRGEICAVVERQLSTRFSLKYVSIAAIRSDGFSILRGPVLSESALRAAQQACALDTGSVVNAQEGFRVFVLAPAQTGGLEPAMVAVFPWPQPAAASWDEMTAILLANLTDQAFKSLERLAALRNSGADHFLRGLQESMVAPITSRSEHHSAHSFLLPGHDVSGFLFGEIRAGHTLFLIFLESSGTGLTALYTAIMAKAGVASLRSLFSEDVLSLMSPSDILGHLLKVLGQENRDLRPGMACFKLPLRHEMTPEFAAVGNLCLLEMKEGDVSSLTTSPFPRTQALEGGFGALFFVGSRRESAGDAFWSTAIRDARRSSKRGPELVADLRTRCQVLADRRQDVAGLVLEMR